MRFHRSGGKVNLYGRLLAQSLKRWKKTQCEKIKYLSQTTLRKAHIRRQCRYRKTTVTVRRDRKH